MLITSCVSVSMLVYETIITDNKNTLVTITVYIGDQLITPITLQVYLTIRPHNNINSIYDIEQVWQIATLLCNTKAWQNNF